MKRRVYIFVRGILGFPGDAKEWNARAVPWIFNNTPDFADNFETQVGVIDRAFGQWRRARNLKRTLLEYLNGNDGLEPTPNIVIVAHSNGADIALKALALARWPRIEALHLVSAACEADFWRNGLNQALCAGLIGHLCLYRAADDFMLRLARTLPGRLLGYGTLGLTGPLNVDKRAEPRVGEIVREHFGHSTWFSGAHFERTMEHFTRPISPANNRCTTADGSPV